MYSKRGGGGGGGGEGRGAFIPFQQAALSTNVSNYIEEKNAPHSAEIAALYPEIVLMQLDSIEPLLFDSG